MSAVDPKGDMKYWGDGLPFEGARLQPTEPGEMKYWSDGMPEENIFPLNNNDTGKFLLVFE